MWYNSGLNIDESVVLIHSQSDSAALIDSALHSALLATGATAGSVMLWDECQKELILKAAHGWHSDRLRNVHIKLKEGISGWVGECGDCILVTDIQSDDRFQYMKRKGQYRSSSFISLPLVHDHKLIGVLNLTEREGLSAFTEQDLKKAKILAQHISLALERLRTLDYLSKDNAYLHEKVLKLERQIVKIEKFYQPQKEEAA